MTRAASDRLMIFSIEGKSGGNIGITVRFSESITQRGNCMVPWAVRE